MLTYAALEGRKLKCEQKTLEKILCISGTMMASPFDAIELLMELSPLHLNVESVVKEVDSQEMSPVKVKWFGAGRQFSLEIG